VAKIVWRDLHGLLLLDKPLGLSSNQALQAARKLLRAAKGGHTGALDPLATGLLPLCFGEGTKIAGTLLGSRKAYLAECRLGATTTTADLEGEVVERRPVPTLDAAAVEAALAPLRGRITQVPPVYSAIKQDGEPLYLKARRGETVEVPSRDVEIFTLTLLEHAGDSLRLYVECGSGTYIRSLAVDLGEALGCGAHLTALRRLWVDPFEKPQMVTLDQLQQAAEQGDGALDALVLPVAAGLAHLPEVHLSADDSASVARGRKVQGDFPVAERVAAYADDGRLLALAQVDSEGFLQVLRGFNLASAPAIQQSDL
jgi:tRNA pseudouridine55 synthase